MGNRKHLPRSHRYGTIELSEAQSRAVGAFVDDNDPAVIITHEDFSAAIVVALKVGVLAILNGRLDGATHTLMLLLGNDPDGTTPAIGLAHILSWLVSARDDPTRSDDFPDIAVTAATGLITRVGEHAIQPDGTVVELDTEEVQAALRGARALLGVGDNQDMTFNELFAQHEPTNLLVALLALVAGVVVASGGDINMLDTYDLMP